jgi:hypothetical protein
MSSKPVLDFVEDTFSDDTSGAESVCVFCHTGEDVVRDVNKLFYIIITFEGSEFTREASCPQY